VFFVGLIVFIFILSPLWISVSDDPTLQAPGNRAVPIKIIYAAVLELD